MLAVVKDGKIEVIQHVAANVKKHTSACDCGHSRCTGRKNSSVLYDFVSEKDAEEAEGCPMDIEYK